MHTLKLLHKAIESKLLIHKTRLKNLLEATRTLLQGHKLTLTSLGRNLSKKNQTRSHIKKIDRLLGNVHLQKESTDIYKLMNHYLIREHTRPWIHVDWSCLCSVSQLYVLRATLTMQGRSIVIHEACYPKTKENTPDTHRQFLDHLKKQLPSSVTPIIVTDAGFRAPWFAYVKHLGWDFVGRLRSKMAIKFNDSADFILSKCLYEKATSTPQWLGEGLLTQVKQVPVQVVLFQGKKKHRHKLNKHKVPSQSSLSRRYSSMNKEPWLLVTSLKAQDALALKTVNIYRQRMRIEENIRDTKSTRYGFGLEESRTRSTERMNILLLIAALATFACWIAGIYVRKQGYAPSFQAQSAAYTRALSLVYLGKEALKKGLRITHVQFQKMLMLLPDINDEAQKETELCV